MSLVALYSILRWLLFIESDRGSTEVTLTPAQVSSTVSNTS